MIVLTLARKPLIGSVASNVLRFGTGGVNIDECRLSTQDSLQGGTVGLLFNVRDNREWGYHAGPNSNGYLPSSLGRWPANLILQHLPGCQCLGMKQVEGDGHYPKTRGAGSQVCGASGHQGQERLIERSLSLEAVQDWSCEPECPVRALDAQSGITQGTGRNSSGGSAFGQGLGWNPHNNRVTEIVRMNDFGGASRFFKQVQSRSSSSASDRSSLKS